MGVEGEIEQDDCETHKTDKSANSEQHVGNVCEGRPIDECSCLWRLKTHSHDCDWKDEGGEGEKAHHADGPGEADFCDETVEDDWIDDTAN